MLRQIKRVVKFWREYIGDQSIESVGNKELSGYIEWRKSYYAQFKTLPKNAKLNPADKTLQWETTLGKSIVRWAHEQGYRGDQLLPTFSFTPKTKRVRPAFELFEYRRLLRTLIKWQRNCPNETWLHARRLLTDYVLVLANSGMRVGEANNLKIRDLEAFEDDLGRRNYRFKVKGKTGERDVILRASAAKSVDRLLTRRSGAGDDWLFVIAPSTTVRAARRASSRPHLAAVLREGRKSANIYASLGFIRGIPDKVSPPFLKRKVGRPYAISAYGDPVVRVLQRADIHLQPKGPDGPLGEGNILAGQGDRFPEERSLERLVSGHQSEWGRAGFGA
jgi:integrase